MQVVGCRNSIPTKIDGGRRRLRVPDQLFLLSLDRIHNTKARIHVGIVEKISVVPRKRKSIVFELVTSCSEKTSFVRSLLDFYQGQLRLHFLQQDTQISMSEALCNFRRRHTFDFFQMTILGCGAIDNNHVQLHSKV